MRQRLVLVLIVVILLGLVIFFSRDFLFKQVFRPRSTWVEEGIIREEGEGVQIVAENLVIPWEIVFLPHNEILVTERGGRLLRIGEDKQVIEVQGVEPIGEGGLLGMALHPDFENNSLLYLYLTSRTNGELVNRVERYRLEGERLLEKTIILEGVSGAAVHDGGRIEFGPDGFLYITTGDAGRQELAQDKSSLNGKILRLKDDGSIPADNPFNDEIYSWGHRNPQGLAWDEEGRLWATEHGPSGLQSGFDELNFIEKGKNYGWPVIKGEETREGMVSPVRQSGSTDTWAPAGMVFWDGSLFFSGLRGEALYEYKIKEEELKIHFREEFGRIRAVVLGPDGFLYITTSNRDGRGIPQETDDKLIRINLDIFRRR